MYGMRTGGEMHGTGGEVREAAAHRRPPAHASGRERVPAAAAVAASSAASARVGEPGAGREHQDQQYSDRLFHASLLAENSDEEV
jgi:hypothetical protein